MFLLVARDGTSRADCDVVAVRALRRENVLRPIPNVRRLVDDLGGLVTRKRHGSVGRSVDPIGEAVVVEYQTIAARYLRVNEHAVHRVMGQARAVRYCDAHVRAVVKIEIGDVEALPHERFRALFGLAGTFGNSLGAGNGSDERRGKGGGNNHACAIGRRGAFLPPLNKERMAASGIDGHELKHVAPVLRVADLERAISYYRRQLGFDLEFQFEEFYAGLVRDGCRLHLKHADAPIAGRPFDADEHVDACFMVEDAARLAAALAQAGAAFAVPLRNAGYGKEFYVSDSDGNVLAFVQRS